MNTWKANLFDILNSNTKTNVYVDGYEIANFSFWGTTVEMTDNDGEMSVKLHDQEVEVTDGEFLATAILQYIDETLTYDAECFFQLESIVPFAQAHLLPELTTGACT